MEKKSNNQLGFGCQAIKKALAAFHDLRVKAGISFDPLSTEKLHPGGLNGHWIGFSLHIRCKFHLVKVAVLTTHVVVKTLSQLSFTRSFYIAVSSVYK